MSEMDAAAELRGDVAPVRAPSDGEAGQPEKPGEKPKGPPQRRFKWMETSTLTIEHWLAGQARADIEVFPGMIYRFREMTNAEMRGRDRYLNVLAPEFTMRGAGEKAGNGDRINMPQWGRLRNIGTLVLSIEALNEKPWPPGKDFDEKFKSVEGLGWVLTDRLVEAYQEFEEHLMFLVEGADLPNS